MLLHKLIDRWAYNIVFTQAPNMAIAGRDKMQQNMKLRIVAL